ncbi:MAG TPA: DUF6788 family protein [Ktedonobacteraceae bacterium]
MARIPNNQHITYQFQFRKCGKPSCSTCKSGQGHGPYWYAYWREGSRLKSGYVGKKKIVEATENNKAVASATGAATPVAAGAT